MMNVGGRDGGAITAAQFLARFVKSEAGSYTHLRAHENVLEPVCRLLLENKKNIRTHTYTVHSYITSDNDTKQWYARE